MLIKQKSEFSTLFAQFYEFVLTQFNKKIKIVRTDNERELTKGETLFFYNAKGIEHQTSCVDTPQQNGVFEIKHRHLLEVTRALFFQSKVPMSFWGDCVQCVAHLINKMPLVVLNKRMHFKILYSKAPSYDMPKSFGCLAYASTLKRDRSKLDPRAHPCVFLGYAQNQKGYKLYDLQ